MTERPRTWLGWPVWVVSVVLIVAAVTGGAGPVSVIWALGTVSVALSMAWIYVSGLWRSGRRDPADPRQTDPAESPAADPRPPAGTTAGGAPGSSPP